MLAHPISIIRFADGDQPGWVDCQLVDVEGKSHQFYEKIPIVTKEYLGPESVYPCEGILACEVTSIWEDESGRYLARIDTATPWGVESKEGISQFVVLRDALHSLD